MLTMVLFGVVGAGITLVSMIDKPTLDKFCASTLGEEYGGFLTGPVIRGLETAVTEVDGTLGNLLNTGMCSEECPCEEGVTSNQWTNMDELELNKYNRTKITNG